MDLYNNPEAVRSLDNTSILSNTFFRMFLGLLASALTAFYAYYSGMYVSLVMNGSYFMLAIAEVVVVLVFSLLFRKLSPTAVTVLFYVYAFLNGFTLSVFFAAYQLTSITYAFLATAGMFGVLSYVGTKTNRDISKLGNILFVALIVGLVLTLINIFIGSSMLDIVLDWAMLLVFSGLTVYDINKIKIMQEQGFCNDEKLYVYGAMELYLDFINIFLRILSLFGKRRD